ncbi:hypothetical protein GUF49_06740, partial [Xanthomonas citri pv. citri]|nr:hypothetical protein [Xanthomonas citri pv. citri]
MAYTYCPSKALKKVYREFRAAHPDVYDYAKSLIPAPLNEEQESVISEEKKKQRAAKKLRQKAYSAKKEQLLKEQKERERFL